MKKAIYIMTDDTREGDHKIYMGKGRQDMNNCNGHIEYSHKDACTYALRRMWYANAEDRTFIDKLIAEHGIEKAYHHYASAWNYCVTFTKKIIDTDKF